jgi:site-specific DNA-methyltransferase (adenine-specific)
MGYQIYNGLFEEWAKGFEGDPFHGFLSDPPYHLTSISDRFGGDHAAPAKAGRDGAFFRLSRGFMGKSWDGGDIAFRAETWEPLRRILYPGAFGIAFAGTRGYHRMATAIEDAGFIIHPAIGWLFGNGFPKQTPVTDPVFDGRVYGGQALKPALEFICVFQNPTDSDTQIESIRKYGTGTFNIEGSRVPVDPEDENRRDNPSVDAAGGGVFQINQKSNTRNPTLQRGRYPANLVIDDPAGDYLDQVVGDRPAGAGNTGEEPSSPSRSVYAGGWSRTSGFESYADSGGPSRFFPRYSLEPEAVEAIENQIQESDPFRYIGKASPDEREGGLRWDFPCLDCGKYGTTQHEAEGKNGKIILKSCRRNEHPTIKPISLTEWLARLILPPGAYAPRRMLIPFSGAGSEMIGAVRAGWDQVQGIEMTPEYVLLAEARLKFWGMQGVQRGLFE